MYTNSTNFGASYQPGSSGSLPKLPFNSTTPNTAALYVGFDLPRIKVKQPKYRGLPDQPDRAAMRARRAESEMTVARLRDRTATPIKNDSSETENEQCKHEEPTGSTHEIGNQNEHTTDLISYESGYGTQIIQSMKNFFDYLFAKPVLNFEPFSDYYSKDFEIWRNTGAHLATTLRGMVFVFGEKHSDENVASMIAGVMMSIDPKFENGRLFREGMYRSCSAWENGLLLRPGYCQLMEKDSEIYIKLDQMREVVLSKARACAEFVQQNLRLAVDTIPADVSYPRDYEKYVNRHLDRLPFFARVVLEPMLKDYNDLNTQWETMRSESMGPRDQHMANKIRQGLTHDGPNFVVVGSAHLKGLREQLNDLPCIFMNPKKVVAEFPSTTLREGPLNLGRKKL
jgi:hypothetical protein